MAKIRIRLVKSVIGSLPKQRATVRSLGLRKIGSVNELEASPAVLGMVRVVSHMVSIEKLPSSEEQSSSGELGSL